MIELIPAIDLIDGKCVRLTKGDYATRKIYNEDPVAVAREFESYGFKRLHIVDLDGARSKHIVNYRVLERIAASAPGLTIDFGGGIKLFLEWLQKYGAARLILGADVKNGLISINGWKEESREELLPFLSRYLKEGMRHVLCTDISKDGMLQGPATPLYQEIMAAFPDCKLIASGGVSGMPDIIALDEAGIPAVVFGKAIYEGKISLKELAAWAENKQ